MPVVGGSRAYVAAVVCLLVGTGGLVGCGGGGSSSARPDPQVSSSSADPDPPVLTNGKVDEQITAGTYRAPAGFEPGLLLEIPAGWTSVHRYPDAFDLGRPDPDRDAPLLAVVFLRPPERSADAALAGVRRRATGQVVPVRGDLAGSQARGLDVMAAAARWSSARTTASPSTEHPGSAPGCSRRRSRVSPSWWWCWCPMVVGGTSSGPSQRAC